MSKKKGLGQHLNKSLEIIDDLAGALREFHKIPVKKGLHSNKVDDPQLNKLVNDALEKAFNLSILVEDMRQQITGAKPPKANSRFASQRVVEKFLSL
jgi:FMN phosphatase YigB (HAD superfamily)